MAFIIDGTTGIATPDGSVSAPSQRGQDLNSGISYSSDTIKFSTNGVERLAISNSGLSGDGSGLTGVSAGKILKVHSVSSTTHQSSQSTSYIDVTNMTVTLTPAATSKCFVHVVMNGYTEGLNTFSVTNYYKLLRDSTEISKQVQNIRLDNSMSINYLQNGGSIVMAILDTHGKDGSTSVTYKVQGKTNNGYFHINSAYDLQSSITVYEVAPN